MNLLSRTLQINERVGKRTNACDKYLPLVLYFQNMCLKQKDYRYVAEILATRRKNIIQLMIEREKISHESKYFMKLA